MQEEKEQTTQDESLHFQIIYTMSNGERVVGVESFGSFKECRSNVQTWLENDVLHVFLEDDRSLTLKTSHVVSYAIRQLESKQIAETIRQMALGNVQPQQAPQPNRAERRAKAKKGKK